MPCSRKAWSTWGVMLGREHDIAEACQARQHGPIARLELMRVEAAGQLEKALDVIFGGAYQGMADGGADLAVQAPVDEEAEAGIPEPLDALVAVGGGGGNQGGAQQGEQGREAHTQ